MNALTLSQAEELAILDTSFLKTKREVMDKIILFMSNVAMEYENIYYQSKLTIPFSQVETTPKVTKGENYNGYPFINLDFPRLFSKDSTFALRTLFYWGHFFSLSIHIGGNLLQYIDAQTLCNNNQLFSKPTYISVGNTPWQYHYEIENYKLINKDNFIDLFTSTKENGFVKLSRKIEINPDFNKLKLQMLEHYADLLSIVEETKETC